MARIEHVNLVVHSLEDTIKFFKTALPAWTVRGRGEGTWFGVPRQWVHFGTADDYITLNDGAVGRGRQLTSVAPGLAHIGIEVESVDEVCARLADAGYPVEIVGPSHPHRKTVYFIEPSGTEVEFVQYFSETAPEKNLYGGETTAVQRLYTPE